MAKALALERRLTKEQVLGLYLTLAPFGGNLEGVRAASLAYFGKEPARLSPAECALLVALPRSPERLRPDRHPEAARAARDRVLLRMAEAGVISPAVLAEARDETIADPSPRHAVPGAASRASVARRGSRRTHASHNNRSLAAATDRDTVEARSPVARSRSYFRRSRGRQSRPASSGLCRQCRFRARHRDGARSIWRARSARRDRR